MNVLKKKMRLLRKFLIFQKISRKKIILMILQVKQEKVLRILLTSNYLAGSQELGVQAGTKV